MGISIMKICRVYKPDYPFFSDPGVFVGKGEHIYCRECFNKVREYFVLILNELFKAGCGDILPLFKN